MVVKFDDIQLLWQKSDGSTNSENCSSIGGIPRFYRASRGKNCIARRDPGTDG